MVYSHIYLVLLNHVMCRLMNNTVFWEVTSFSVVEITDVSEGLAVSIFMEEEWGLRRRVSLNRWSISTTGHGVKCHKATSFIVTNMRSSNLLLHTHTRHGCHARTGHGGPEGEYKYRSILYLTSVLDEEDGQRHATAA
jgi:hypothetical protein